MAGRRFPGSSFELSAPELNAIVALRADIASARQMRRILGLSMLGPAALIGLGVGLYADVECRVDCSEADEDARRAAGRVGSAGVLLALGMGWLMSRFGNDIRDHRREMRDIRRRGPHAGLVWR